MPTDIRVAITCADHPKTIKLMRRLGDGSFWNLIKFWCFVAANKPSGDISCLDSEDIEIGAGWAGEHDTFYKALLDLKFIVKKMIHLWSMAGKTIKRSHCKVGKEIKCSN